ncbi:hypothetical protein [Salinicoccus roseus]|nr:hypothetical protein [Salinicoccus roseus]
MKHEDMLMQEEISSLAFVGFNMFHRRLGNRLAGLPDTPCAR